MNKKEMKCLAQKIAKQEKIFQTSEDPAERYQAQKEITKLASRITSIVDMMAIDEMLQKILENN